MKLIPKLNGQSILSILFGISLATFGLSVATLFYNMFEKDGRKKYYGKPDRIRKKVLREYCLDGIPEECISAIIGKDGRKIKFIEEVTDTRIIIEERNQFCSKRTCIVQFGSKDKFDLAIDMMKEIIDKCVGIETYKFFVPFEVSGRTFRDRDEYREGEVEQNWCGASVTFDLEVHKTAIGLKREINLRGKADQIASAINQIVNEIEREVQALPRRRFPSETHFKDANVINIIDKCRNGNAFEYFLPYESCKKIIKEDECVQKIERFSGAIIHNETLKYEGEERKVIIIRGETEKQVKLAYNLINSEVARPESLECLPLSVHPKASGRNDPILQQYDLMNVYVSAVKSPSLFWIQVFGSAYDFLQRYIDDMTEYYEGYNDKGREIKSLEKITVGQKVAAKFPYDGRWCRAEVISIVNSTMCEVFYVDYGDVEIISKNDMFDNKYKDLCLRPQAVECSLANVKPQEETWDIKVTEKFAELVHLAKWKPLVAKVKGFKEYPVDNQESHRHSSLIPCIELFDKATFKESEPSIEEIRNTKMTK